MYEESNQHAKHAVQLMRRAGVGEALIYAYMESGWLITSENVHLAPPGYVKEFEGYVKEYQNAMNEPLKDNQINVLLLVSIANDILKDLAFKLRTNLRDAYNYFIKKHLEGNKDFFNYEVNSVLDYGGLCAMKTLNNLESIHKLAEHELEENILATSRSIFESYLYMVALNRSEEFFEENILNANHEQPVSIASLAKQSKYRQDRQLYNSFFRESSRFVHLDVLSAQAYFKEYQPFTEINRSLIAYVIGVTFAVLNLEQISMFKECDDQFCKDISYLVEHAKKDLLDGYRLIASIPSSQSGMYDKLKQRLEN
ncbi:hypothetical protein QWJ34_08585 [Saccharibacillus sp. CPCC 101409]|uniref:hypothetical protein n=1 Tax=Saccharibacillus sp. CPCC 101409 TaxID=3058041 RepID=UPI0026735F88|nr:hypothetical protein [Saccharibacillus sp. CPCC 101409]MDO3409818.1 hypothetical protein [Saccharibacillus sp. CPCC 101409]